jgi:urate oxidase
MRQGAQHQVIELTATVLLEGDFEEAYIDGDNRNVLPTDTIKNTVYVIARQNPIQSIEEFAIHLAGHFLSRLPKVTKVSIEMEQTPWGRIGNHGSAFTQGGEERRWTSLASSRNDCVLRSGLRNLHILKTSNSAFRGYMRDEYTTLPETDDRLLSTVVDADWTYAGEDIQFNQLHQAVRSALLECFADHNSLSVQHTLFAMGQHVLDQFPDLVDIRLVMPNKHCLRVDLERFGLENKNQLFVPTDEPSGRIEAHLKR